MSVAWTAPVDLWREPVGATARRLVWRAVAAAALIGAAMWVPWQWLSLILAGLSVPWTLNFAAALVNLAVNRRVTLRLTPSGVIEWPRSLQEYVLRRPADYVDGTDIAVIPPETLVSQIPSEPRVRIKGATHEILSFPLHGTAPDDFVAALNVALAGRGITLRVSGGYVEAAQRDDEAAGSDAGATEDGQ